MAGLLRDLRYAWRTFRRAPGFAVVATLMLALGIGANTAIFSVVQGVLLRPLPYPAPDRLVRVFQVTPPDGVTAVPGTFSPQDFDDLVREATTFEALAGYYFVPGQSEMVLAADDDEPEELQAALVSGRFFTVFGVPPALGRGLGDPDMVTGADHVAVLADDVWRRRFGADPTVVGRRVTLDNEPFTIVGVMPARFDGPSPDADIWAPLSLIGDEDIPHRRALRWMHAVGRLSAEQTIDAARLETNAILHRLEAAYPESNTGWGEARVVPLADTIVGDVRAALLVLAAAVAFVLLIACTNLANLLLARGSARTRELAIRGALGAGRARLVRQLLTESIALALIGGAMGLLLSLWGIDALVALSAGTIPRPDAIGIDGRVVVFTVAISIVTGLVFGLLPSMTAARGDLNGRLKDGGRTADEGRGGMATRWALVMAEMALAMVLLTSAGLLIKSFWNLYRVDPGFERQNVLALSVSMPSEIMAGPARLAYRRELLARVSRLPGVIAVGGSKTMPLSGNGEPFSFSLPGSTDADPITPEAGGFIVTPGYFEALGVPVVRGRVFTADDEASRALVTVINKQMADRYWPGEDPVGKGISAGSAVLQIVGIVGDVHTRSLADAPQPAVYLPSFLASRSAMKLFVRTTSDPALMAGAVQTAIREVNPAQPVSDVTTLEKVIDDAVARPRFVALLVGAFGGLAALLAALGVYGVLAYAASRRTHEVGVRMALGAGAGDVRRLLVRQGLVPAVVGLLIGAVAATAVTRVLTSLLFGVTALDPSTFLVVGLLLIVAAALAVYVPARRASKVDPMIALRQE